MSNYKNTWLNVEVIGVELREGVFLEDRVDEHASYGYKTIYTYSKPDKNAPKSTLVLYTANGELKTKEFIGQWTLEEVRNWSKERFVEEDD